MRKPNLHVHNIFDALNPLGSGVNGYLKLKCLQLQNRVVGLADPGDIITISDDCPQAFVDYMADITGIGDIVLLRYKVNPDPRRFLNAHAVFDSLSQHPRWEEVLQKSPELSAYIQSRAVYRAAHSAGITIPQAQWQAIVIEGLSDRMNDKASLYRDCEQLGLPIPQHWILQREELVDRILTLLDSGEGPLYIRQARSSGAFGNITVERINSHYMVKELEARELEREEFSSIIEYFARSSVWHEFVVAELLDLFASPGTLFFVSDEGVSVISHTHQILSTGRRFQGFLYPITNEKITKHFPQIEQAAQMLVEPWRIRGYRGYGNIDWMVTTAGESYIAEINARETAVIPPLKIENAISKLHQPGLPVAAPARTLFVRDKITLTHVQTFEGAYAALSSGGLLWGQHKSIATGEQRGDAGIIIYSPPSPVYGINTVGIMAIADLPVEAFEIYRKALDVLGVDHEDLLFDPHDFIR